MHHWAENAGTGWLSGFVRLVLDPRVNVDRGLKILTCTVTVFVLKPWHFFFFDVSSVFFSWIKPSKHYLIGVGRGVSMRHVGACEKPSVLLNLRDVIRCGTSGTTCRLSCCGSEGTIPFNPRLGVSVPEARFQITSRSVTISELPVRYSLRRFPVGCRSCLGAF